MSQPGASPYTVDPLDADERPTLQAENVQRWLGSGAGRVHVLRGVDLAIRPGRLYAISGPSGCGKSTLLYLLGLLDTPDSGNVWLQGRLMTRASENERTRARNAHIGFVFQFHFLLPEFTALENLLLPMRRLGTRPPREMRAHAAAMLAEVGLADKRDRRANQLSGGEQQRVAIARALANDPAVILADEPTGNLDMANSRLVLKLLQRLAHEKGQAVVMVTHNPELAGMCDQVLAMRDGLFVDA